MMKNQEGVFVADVTVRYEDGDYFQMGRWSQIELYAWLLPDLQQKFGIERGEGGSYRL
jgi:hypothetical protein